MDTLFFSTSMLISSFGTQPETTMDMAFVMRLYWQDPRLMFPDLRGDVNYGVSFLKDNNRTVLNFHPQALSSMWVPELFMENEKTSNDLKLTSYSTGSSRLRIDDYGFCYLEQRRKAKISCEINFKQFPMDEQVCSFNIESFINDKEELRLEWASPNAIDFASGIKLPYFNFKGTITRLPNDTLFVKVTLRATVSAHAVTLLASKVNSSSHDKWITTSCSTMYRHFYLS